MVTISPLQIKDAEPLARLANNKKIFDNVRDHFPHPYTKEDAIEFIERVSLEEPILTFSIRFEETFAGVIMLFPQTDVYKHSYELGYWLGEPYWNKGIVSRAIQIMLKYAFEELGGTRIFAAVFGYNAASMKVLEKNGFQKEGVLRKAVFKNQVFVDEHRYGKLASD